MANREDTLLALTGKRPKYVPCYFSDVQFFSTPLHGEALPPGCHRGMDAYGVELIASPEAGGAVTPAPVSAHVIEDVCNWRDDLVLPDYKSVDWTTAARTEAERRKAAPELFVQDFIYPKGPFERLHFLMGFEGALCAILDEPEDTYDLLSAITDNKIEFIHRIAEAYHPDMITVMDDYAHQDGLLMAPHTFREMFKPHLKRLVEAVHSHGILYKQHCCGKMDTLLDDFIEIGIDALDPVQPTNDIPNMQKRMAGKIGLCGGLDAQNVVDCQTVTEEKLRAEVRRCIDHYGRTGGYMPYCATIDLRNPEAYQPGGRLHTIIDECQKYGSPVENQSYDSQKKEEAYTHGF